MSGDAVVTASELDVVKTAMRVGGRNLLLNSATMQGDSWYIKTNTLMTDNGDGTLSYSDKGDWHSTRYRAEDLVARGLLVVGEQYTYSEDIFIGDDMPGHAYISLYSKYASAAGAVKVADVSDLGSGWYRLSCTFTAIEPVGETTDYANAIRFEISGTNGSSFKLARPKLELGPLATPYSPAPEDLTSTIAALTARVTALESK